MLCFAEAAPFQDFQARPAVQWFPYYASHSDSHFSLISCTGDWPERTFPEHLENNATWHVFGKANEDPFAEDKWTNVQKCFRDAFRLPPSLLPVTFRDCVFLQRSKSWTFPCIRDHQIIITTPLKIPQSGFWTNLIYIYVCIIWKLNRIRAGTFRIF